VLKLPASFITCVLLTSAGLTSAQVFKCQEGSRTTYQSTPCDDSQRSQTIKIEKSPPPPPVEQPRATVASSNQKASTETDRASDRSATIERPVVGAIPEVVGIGGAPSRRQVQGEADICLDWYRQLLRDPLSAYFSNPSKDGRVLSIIVHAKNGFGGVVEKSAACEIKSGSLDHDWTKIHAKRLGW
jgi:Domain of unknown function (DUF4124)